MQDNLSPPAVARFRRFTRRRALTGLIVLLLLVIAADLALRYGAGLGNPVIYQADAACGYVPVANQKTRRFGSLNVINAFNQRSADLSQTKPPGHFRLLLIGDSVTYGTTYVDQADIFASRLARDLPQKLGKPVDVMNAAVGAWAVGNEVGYLRSRGTFGADLVLFVLNPGDLIQPFNSLNPPPEVASGYPAVKPWCALGELWRRYLWPRLKRKALPRDAGSRPEARGVWDARSQQQAQTVLNQLDQARAICQKAHARLGIVYSPCAGKQWFAPPYPQALEQLKQWCHINDIPFVSLADAYARSTPDKIYWDGTHLRPKGNALAAAGIEANWEALAGGR